jgi:RNA polymerase sigma-32 factor
MFKTVKATGATGSLLVRQARQQAFLTVEAERELARRAAGGDAAAAEALIVSHLAVVITVARRYGRLGLPVNDLIQEGTVGLIHAVRKFDPDRNARLATYALWWIRAAIQDYVVRSWSLVRVGKTAAHKALFFSLKRHGAESRGEGRGDSLEEDVLGRLARRFGLPPAEVAGLARRVAAPDQPLDAPVSDRGRGAGKSPGLDSFADRLAADQPTPEDIVAATGMTKLWATLIDKALAMLPPREAAIVRERHLVEVAKTFEAIGRELGLSKDRVRQLEKQALARLHDLLKPLAAAHGLPG